MSKIQITSLVLDSQNKMAARTLWSRAAGRPPAARGWRTPGPPSPSPPTSWDCPTSVVPSTSWPAARESGSTSTPQTHSVPPCVRYNRKLTTLITTASITPTRSVPQCVRYNRKPTTLITTTSTTPTHSVPPCVRYNRKPTTFNYNSIDHSNTFSTAVCEI